MAYSIVNFVEVDDTGTGVVSITAPNFTVTAGNALVAFLWHQQPLRITTLSDTVGSNDSWTEVGTGHSESGNCFRSYYLLNSASGSFTLNVGTDQGVDYPALAVVELSGIVTSSALVGYAADYLSNPGTSANAITSGNTGTLTSQPAAVIAMCINIDSDSTPAAGTSPIAFTSSDSLRAWDFGLTLGGRLEHARVTSTTAVSGTFTDSTNGASSPYHTFVVALAESGSTQSNAPRVTRHLQNMMRG